VQREQTGFISVELTVKVKLVLALTVSNVRPVSDLSNASDSLRSGPLESTVSRPRLSGRSEPRARRPHRGPATPFALGFERLLTIPGVQRRTAAWWSPRSAPIGLSHDGDATRQLGPICPSNDEAQASAAAARPGVAIARSAWRCLRLALGRSVQSASGSDTLPSFARSPEPQTGPSLGVPDPSAAASLREGLKGTLSDPTGSAGVLNGTLIDQT
jgi:hypothetical protein